jgi:hypothetical protein
LASHFDGTIRKVRQLVGSWERYNLSLPGKIGIAKTMLISQIGYIGCIITPTEAQLNTLQELIDGYVTRGIVLAKDRLYTKAREGGLGLIKLESYVAALQCSWIKRCSKKINDSWRWTLASACRFDFSNLRPDSLLESDHPILKNILVSFTKMRDNYSTINENFCEALLVDNPLFLRAPPERRAPVRGLVDRNLLGHAFYDTNKEKLLDLKLSCLVRIGRTVTFNQLRANTGLGFAQATYLNLVTAGNFAVKKYGNKVTSNGTCFSVNWLLSQVRKGSKKFRRILDVKNNTTALADLRVVNTFFELINVEKPENVQLKELYGSWNWSFMSNRFRTFCFQFVNNSLGIKTRIAARYRNRAVMLEDKCTFCLKANIRNPSRESFLHLFYECPCINGLSQRLLTLFFPHVAGANLQRRAYLSGIVDGTNGSDIFFNTVTALSFNYIIWQCRLKKIIPGMATVLEEFDNIFNNLTCISEGIRESAVNSGTLVCRRWRELHHGRG